MIIEHGERERENDDGGGHYTCQGQQPVVNDGTERKQEREGEWLHKLTSK